jgi:hypothetical protein
LRLSVLTSRGQYTNAGRVLAVLPNDSRLAAKGGFAVSRRWLELTWSSLGHSICALDAVFVIPRYRPSPGERDLLVVDDSTSGD